MPCRTFKNKEAKRKYEAFKHIHLKHHSLPSSIVKKYGINKKAWEIYRGSRSPKRSMRSKLVGVRKMARRRFRRFHRSPRVRRYFRSRGGALTMKNLAIGSAIVSVVEPTLDSMLDKFIPITVAGIDPKDIGKVAIGWYLLKKSGMIKGIGASLMIIGVRNIVRGYVGGGGLGTLFGAPTTQTQGW